ncbi:MAG: hypothetical protein ABMA13_20635 [Chthoniobacteraceae bacterium]
MEVTRELWGKARAAVRACRLLAGRGIRLRWTPDGTVIVADATPPDWNHPFRVGLQGATRAQIVPGTVSGRPVFIDSIALDDDPPPVLEWSKLSLDEEGRGFIAIELACDDRWQLVPATLTLVQVADWGTEDGSPRRAGTPFIEGAPSLSARRTRWPIAMLRQRTRTSVVVAHQIVHAPLTHYAQPIAELKDAARHFFS